VRVPILALRRKQNEKKKFPIKDRKKAKEGNSQSMIGRKQKQKRKRKFPIKDRKKTKEICRKVFGPDNI